MALRRSFLLASCRIFVFPEEGRFRRLLGDRATQCWIEKEETVEKKSFDAKKPFWEVITPQQPQVIAKARAKRGYFGRKEGCLGGNLHGRMGTYKGKTLLRGG